MTETYVGMLNVPELGVLAPLAMPSPNMTDRCFSISGQQRAGRSPLLLRVVRRLSPLGHEHITLTGRYHIALTETIRRGEYRPLKTPDLADLASA